MNNDTINEMLDYTRDGIWEDLIAGLPANVAVAKKYKLGLVCYEGGQNLATENDGNGQNDSHYNLTQLTILANSHPRMRSIYKESFYYFSTLSPGSLFNHFSYMGRGGKYGNWGLTQWQDQQIGVPTPESAPKYAALYEIWQAQGLAPPPPPSR